MSKSSDFTDHKVSRLRSELKAIADKLELAKNAQEAQDLRVDFARTETVLRFAERVRYFLDQFD